MYTNMRRMRMLVTYVQNMKIRKHTICGSLFNYRDLGPRRVWKGGSELQVGTSFPRNPGNPADNSPKHVFEQHSITFCYFSCPEVTHVILAPGACGRGGLSCRSERRFRGIRGRVPKCIFLSKLSITFEHFWSKGLILSNTP